MLFGVRIKMYVFAMMVVLDKICVRSLPLKISPPGLWPRTPATQHLSAKAQLYLSRALVCNTLALQLTIQLVLDKFLSALLEKDAITGRAHSPSLSWIGNVQAAIR